MWACSALAEMGLKDRHLMQLPDGRKSLLHYCQVSGALAGLDFTSGLSLRPCGVKALWLIIALIAD